jgi:hypothetical protein
MWEIPVFILILVVAIFGKQVLRSLRKALRDD